MQADFVQSFSIFRRFFLLDNKSCLQPWSFTMLLIRKLYISSVVWGKKLLMEVLEQFSSDLSEDSLDLEKLFNFKGTLAQASMRN